MGKIFVHSNSSILLARSSKIKIISLKNRIISLKKSQKSLKSWTKQKWRTSDGKKSKGKKRYLPDAAWKSLTPAEKAATNRAKAKELLKEAGYEGWRATNNGLQDEIDAVSTCQIFPMDGYPIMMPAS